jgi:hypothetical protein
MILNKNIPDKELNHFVLIEMRGMTKYNKIHGWTMGSQLIDNIAKYIKKWSLHTRRFEFSAMILS